jgi:hypothetical protein
VDKQPKGLEEKRTNNRKGQKKSGQTIERVKRKVDKQPKWLKEKRTNNRKGQKKRGQTIERVKRKEAFDCFSSFLLTLSIVCPLFF